MSVMLFAWAEGVAAATTYPKSSTLRTAEDDFAFCSARSSVKFTTRSPVFFNDICFTARRRATVNRGNCTRVYYNITERRDAKKLRCPCSVRVDLRLGYLSNYGLGGVGRTAFGRRDRYAFVGNNTYRLTFLIKSCVVKKTKITPHHWV